MKLKHFGLLLAAIAIPLMAHASVQQLVLTNQFGEKSINTVQSPMVSSITAGSNISITGGLGNFTISGSGGGGGVTSVSGTAPVVSSGGSTPAISMHVADSSHNGYLSSADFISFSGKQDELVAGSGISISGVTISATGGGGGADVHLSNLTAPTSIPVELLPTTTDATNLGSATQAWFAGFFNQFQIFSAGDQKGYLIWDGGNSTDIVSNYDLSLISNFKMILFPGAQGVEFQGGGPIVVDNSMDIQPATNNGAKLGLVGKEFLEVHSSSIIGNTMSIQAATGPISLQGHLKSVGSVAVIGACGTSPSVSGTDTAGVITVGSGGVATSCAISFGSAYTAAPHCFVNDQTEVAAVSVVPTTGGFTVSESLAFAAGAKLDYFCVAH